ncbi:MAG: glycosyl hydrolase [Phenylobacterium zucineum]|nr:MAG: glycosyl hydrolase [Phenylobacterium zucineum]
MSKAKVAGASIAALFAALAVAAPGLVEDEGWVLKTYPDPVSIVTACGGVTGKNIKAGVTYTFEECVSLTSRAMLEHGLAIRPCLSGAAMERPQTYGAFIRFAYNTGAPGFCKSSASRRALAGDLAGACRALQQADDGRPIWVWATKPDGTKVQLPGLVRRRAAERAMCERGLA